MEMKGAGVVTALKSEDAAFHDIKDVNLPLLHFLHIFLNVK